MKQIKRSILMAAAALLCIGGASLAQDASSYTKIDAAELKKSPQAAWARSILFTDEVESLPSGRSQRLDKKNYYPMRLKTVGQIWIRENVVSKFQNLQVGGTYSFGGTVDQISRRYYLIVDSCYTIQTAENMQEHWTDMLNPKSTADLAAEQASVSEASMQQMLIQAQNSLIEMAEANGMTVGQLIEAQTDGGQRMAELIVADALTGQLRSQNKTAEELMIESVLALLQKQAILDAPVEGAVEVATWASDELPPPVDNPLYIAEAAFIPPADAAAVPLDDDVDALLGSEFGDWNDPLWPDEDDVAAADIPQVMETASITTAEYDTPEGIEEDTSWMDTWFEDETTSPENTVGRVEEVFPSESIMETAFVLDEIPATDESEQPAQPAESTRVATIPTLKPATAIRQPTETAAPAAVASPAEPPAGIIPMVSVTPTKAEVAMNRQQQMEFEKAQKENAQITAKELAALRKEAKKQIRDENQRLAALEKQVARETRQVESDVQQAWNRLSRKTTVNEQAIDSAIQREVAAIRAAGNQFDFPGLEPARALQSRLEEDGLDAEAASFGGQLEKTSRKLDELQTKKQLAEVELSELLKQMAVADAQAGVQQQQADAAKLAAERQADEKAAALSKAQAAERQAEELKKKQAAEEKALWLEIQQAKAAQAAQEKEERLAAAAAEKQRKAAEREAEKQRKAEARRQQAESRKATPAAAAKLPDVDPSTLPEWMQPVYY